jgi:hypothetical protein
VSELAVSPLPGAPTAVFTLRAQPGDEQVGLLLLLLLLTVQLCCAQQLDASCLPAVCASVVHLELMLVLA